MKFSYHETETIETELANPETAAKAFGDLLRLDPRHSAVPAALAYLIGRVMGVGKEPASEEWCDLDIEELQRRWQSSLTLLPEDYEPLPRLIVPLSPLEEAVL